MILFFFMAALSVEAGEYKFLARTISCQERVSIEAREGDKFVYAIHNGNKRKLISQDGSTYTRLPSKGMMFHSDSTNEKYQLGEPTFEVSLPSSVMSHLPSISIFYSGTSHKCSMTYKD